MSRRGLLSSTISGLPVQGEEFVTSSYPFLVDIDREDFEGKVGSSRGDSSYCLIWVVHGAGS